MISDILVPIVLTAIVLLTILFIVFFIYSIMSNHAKIKVLSIAQQKTKEQIEKMGEKLKPILNNFYGENSLTYLNTIKKQNLVSSNRLLSLMTEYKPNIASTLPEALELMNTAYVNAFHEASLAYHELVEQNQSIAEESAQYLNLIEQLRCEKTDQQEMSKQSLLLLEQIHQKYQVELDLPKYTTFKKLHYDELISAFKLKSE